MRPAETTMKPLLILNDPPQKLLLCGTCMDGLGVSEAELREGARGSMTNELAGETIAADKTLAF
jgi:hypothetical protein